ncbi:hypothetical protein CDAR_553651 [Caerostris darwini]|uniref:Uncharacterized protein n=1 Tax=Caerostris darwini TaxID=1538125 RepID=A0AAV4TBE3_9ARAC|nr:hypothetical protein CDAR_553651 [Caerostris darwini]
MPTWCVFGDMKSGTYLQFHLQMSSDKEIFIAFRLKQLCCCTNAVPPIEIHNEHFSRWRLETSCTNIAPIRDEHFSEWCLETSCTFVDYAM